MTAESRWAASPAPSGEPGLRHRAAFFDDRSDLITQIVPVVRRARHRGDALVLDLLAPTHDALTAELGPLDGAHEWAHQVGVSATSAQTTAFHRARRLEAIVSAGAGPVTAVTEHDPRLDGSDGRFWAELDAAANLAMDHLPLELTCWFPRFAARPAVFADACRTHPVLLRGGSPIANPSFRPPLGLAAPVPAPPAMGRPDERIELSSRELVTLRGAVTDRMRAVRCDRDRVEDWVVAVNEVATNALEHGGGAAHADLWGDDDGCVVEIHNPGVSRTPLPGMRPPVAGQRREKGLWVARQMCPYLHVWTDPAGTHVRMRLLVPTGT